MMKLEEFPMDFGFVNPDKVSDMKPLGSGELVGLAFILKMSIEFTKTKLKGTFLYKLICTVRRSS